MIYLELVPRDLDNLLSEAQHSLSAFSDLSGINVPDIKRISIRSTTACEHLLNASISSIPHIRCMDFSLEEHLKRTESMLEKGLDSILLISGDPPESNSRPQHDVSPLALTKALKLRWPQLNVYCGLDPYRQSFQAELRYAQDKLDAGADGLFSQPFFDTNLAQMYCEQLSHCALFIGISPVLSIQSYNYWVSVNKVVFPRSFETTLDYNTNLAKDLLRVSKDYSQHAYIMPIKTDINDYLTKIFSN